MDTTDLETQIQNKLYLNGMVGDKTAERALRAALRFRWPIEKIILIRTPHGVVAKK